MTSIIVPESAYIIDGGDIDGNNPGTVKARDLQYGQAIREYKPRNSGVLEIGHAEPTDNGEIAVLFVGGRFDKFQPSDEFRLVSDADREAARRNRELAKRRRQHAAFLREIAGHIETGALPIPTSGLSLAGPIGTHEELIAAARALGVEIEDRRGGGTQVDVNAGDYGSASLHLWGPARGDRAPQSGESS